MKIHKSQTYINYLKLKDINIVEKLNREIYKNNNLIGSIFYSKTSGIFKVIKCNDSLVNSIYHNPIYYKIKFCATGYETIATKHNILRGTIKDYLYKSLYGVASHGKDYPIIKDKYPELCKVALSRWNGILRRLYDKDDVGYCRYGAIGVKIDKDWLVFSNFFYDIKEILEQYKLVDEFIAGNLHIDKDILQEDIPANKRIYSKNTISFVTKEENNKYRDTDRIALKNSNYFISKMHGIETLQQNIRKFGRENGIDSRRICESIKYQKPLRHTNFQFRYPTKNELTLISEGKLVPGDIIN